MAIIRSATPQLVDVNDCRPQASNDALDVLSDIVSDQTLAYEAITALAAPSTASRLADEHIHDGDAGAIIPIPLCQEMIRADVPSAPSTAGILSDGYGAIHVPMQLVPDGVDVVRIICYLGGSYNTASRIRIDHRYSTSFTFVAQYDLRPFPNSHPYGPSQVVSAWYADIDTSTTKGVVNQWVIKVAEYAYLNGVALSDITAPFHGYSIVPWVGPPLPTYPHTDSTAESGDILRPSSTRHLGAHAFASFDTAMFAKTPTQGVSSYIATNAILNDALLYELASGRPSSDNTVRSYNGHTHGSGSSLSATEGVGGDIDQPLLSIALGTMRNRPGGSGRNTSNMGASATNFDGRIYAVFVKSGSGTTARTVGRYPFRMPAAAAANIHGGSSRLRFASLAHVDVGKIGSLTVRATIQNSTGTASGTSTSNVHNINGLTVVQGTIDYHGSSAVAASGADAMLLVELIPSSNPPDDGTCGLLSFCLFYEAA